MNMYFWRFWHHFSIFQCAFNMFKCDRSWSLQCGCQEPEGVKRLVGRPADLFSNLQPDRVASCNAASLQFVVTAALHDFRRIASAFASSRGTRPVRTGTTDTRHISRHISRQISPSAGSSAARWRIFCAIGTANHVAMTCGNEAM